MNFIVFFFPGVRLVRAGRAKCIYAGPGGRTKCIYAGPGGLAECIYAGPGGAKISKAIFGNSKIVSGVVATSSNPPPTQSRLLQPKTTQPSPVHLAHAWGGIRVARDGIAQCETGTVEVNGTVKTIK